MARARLVETWIQRDLQKIGINVQLRKYEWVTYLGLWAKGMTDDVGMDEIGWGMSTPALGRHRRRMRQRCAERRELRLLLQSEGRCPAQQGACHEG